MKKARCFLRDLNTSVCHDILTLRSSKPKMIILGFIFALAVIAIYSTPALAATDIFDTVDDMLGSVYGKLVGISTAIYVVAAVLCFLWYMVGIGRDSTEQAIKWFKRATVAWIAINVLGAIVVFIGNLTEGQNYEWSN